MSIIKIINGAWRVQLESGPLECDDKVFRVIVKCEIKGFDDLPSKVVEQQWDFLLIPNVIEYDNEYIHIWFNDDNEKLCHLQIKMESKTTLIIDIFDMDGRLLNEIGCYDMMEYFW